MPSGRYTEITHKEAFLRRCGLLAIITVAAYSFSADSDSNVFSVVRTHGPECADVEVTHASLAVVGLVVAALVGVDDAVVATFDLDALARLGVQVRVLAQPLVSARHQHAAANRTVSQSPNYAQIYLPMSKFH